MFSLWIVLLLNIYSFNATAAKVTNLPPEIIDKLIDANKGSTEDYDSTSGELEMLDKVKLTYTYFIPKNLGDKKAPTVVMPCPWGWLAEVYLLTQLPQELAKEGFIVMMYTSRGFWDSEGLVDLGGPADVKDFKFVVDWMEANLPIDTDRLGTSGISFGAGMALNTLALDPRVKTAVALSSWAHLFDGGLFYGDAVNEKALGELLATKGGPGDRKKGIEPVKKRISDLAKGVNFEQTRAWANVRSPIFHTDKINAKPGASVYIMHTYGDEMFSPNSLLNFYNQITIDKKIEFISGSHGVSHLVDYFARSGVKDRAKKWFHNQLGEQEQIENGITLQIRQPLNTKNSKTKIKRRYETFSKIPAKNWTKEKFYFDTADGTLKLSSILPESDHSQTLYSDSQPSVFPNQNLKTAFIFESITGVLVAEKLKDLPSTTLMYKTPRITEKMEVRGIAKLDLKLKSSSNRGLLVAYLFDLDSAGTLHLISSGRQSYTNQIPEDIFSLELELKIAAYDITPGHQLVVILDTQANGIKSPEPDYYSIKIVEGHDAPSYLEFHTKTPR